MVSFISVICPTFNEEKYISNCLDAIIQSDYPKDYLEVLIIDGISTDNTKEIVLKYSKTYTYIKFLINQEKIVPFALNQGIKEAKGEVIIRIDAHAYYPSNYFSVLVENLFKLDADNVGVVCKTDVIYKNRKTLAIKEVLANKFGVGNSYFRIGIDKMMEVDTVPFGCFKRDVFIRYGLYDTRLARNQDIEFNKRIIKGGGKIFLIPNIYCIYYARETWQGIFKNNLHNGEWNVLTIYYTNSLNTLSIRHFIPLCFVLSILLPLLCSIIDLRIIYFSLFTLSFYVILMFFVSLSISLKKKSSLFFLLITFFILHFSYGLGSLLGLCKLLSLKRK